MNSEEYRFISGAKPDHIYRHEWGNQKGCFIVVMFDEEHRPIDVEIPLRETHFTRIRLRIAFKYSDGALSEIQLKKYRKSGSGEWKDEPSQPMFGELINLKPIGLAKLTSILDVIKSLDLDELKSRRTKLTIEGAALDNDASNQIKTALLRDGGEELIAQLLTDGAVTGKDLVNLGYRREQVGNFREMLSCPKALRDWAQDHNVTSAADEAIWQAFFERNKWIFGLGLDYRFNSLLQREANVGEPDLSGRGSPKSDFLLSDSRFTVLVELKTPDAPIFANRSNRAGTWSLHHQLTESVSQVLVQKAELIGSMTNNTKFLKSGVPVTEETADPKTYLIYGTWPESAQGSERDAVARRRTFELYRRNLRNIEILTFDELLERAQFLTEETS